MVDIFVKIDQRIFNARVSFHRAYFPKRMVIGDSNIFITRASNYAANCSIRLVYLWQSTRLLESLRDTRKDKSTYFYNSSFHRCSTVIVYFTFIVNYSCKIWNQHTHDYFTCTHCGQDRQQNEIYMSYLFMKKDIRFGNSPVRKIKEVEFYFLTNILVLTQWTLEDVVIPLRGWFSHSSCRKVTLVLAVKILSGKCCRTTLLWIKHLFR